MNEIYNRELSWLQFNDRVMQEAMDKSVPLMQRVRFLGIYSNNQDEFIKVRLANILRIINSKDNHENSITGEYNAKDLLKIINQRVETSQNIFRETYAKILNEMEQNGIFVIDEKSLSNEQKEFCLNYFANVVSRRLVTILIKKSMDIPFLADGKLYLGVKMSCKKSVKYAIIQVPGNKECPRFVVLPSANERINIMFVDDIIRLFLNDIFFMFNYESISAYTFKIFRDAELPLDKDASKSVTQKISQGLSLRAKGKPIRMIFDKNMPSDMLEIISGKFGLNKPGQIEAGGKYHLMKDLMHFPVVKPELENSNPKPLQHPLIPAFESFINVIKDRDILLCYPYYTFNHVIDLLREAAVDPKVQSISITLYRIAHHSKIINALINGAKNGKQVTAHIELKARFDETDNMNYSSMLQQDVEKVDCR